MVILNIAIGGIISAATTFIVLFINMKEKKRLLFIEKRFEAYQKAYTLCHAIYWNRRDMSSLEAVARECSEFWNAYNLLLDNKTRSAFHSLYSDLSIYSEQNIRIPITPERRKHSDNIIKTKKLICKKIDLPWLDDVDINDEKSLTE